MEQNIYPQDFEKKIDFSAVRDAISQLCTFRLGKEQVDSLSFLTDYKYIQFRLTQAREMTAVLSDSSLQMPSSAMHDLRESLSRIRIVGLFLDEDELLRLRVAVSSFIEYSSFFANLDKQRFPTLQNAVNEHTELLQVVSPIVGEIDRIIDKYGRMKDSASPELSRIRKDLQGAQGSVSRVLSTILRQAQAEGYVEQDVVPTIREGRLVIPVSPSYKRKISGIVHDESATGKTVYIEPQQVVEANNRIRELESEEKRERSRILLDMTARIRPVIPQLNDTQFFLARIDFLRAKALYAIQINAISPELKPLPIISWRQARHPILEARLTKQNKSIVPLNIKLGGKERILVISGPNAGGKSVCLKTVALLQYMLQCGLPIPVREDSVVGVFDSLFIDIGDEQSIEDDLSTYSSHLRNMKFMLHNSRSGTLFLIDELGGGTEPRIGGAIAQAVVAELNRHGSMGVITTHYDNLKHFAEDTEGIINGAMLYDRQQLRPLFELSQGQAGSSFALEIATQIGLDKKLLEQARLLAGEEHVSYEKHLQDIARDKHYWQVKREKVREREKVLEEKIAEYEEQMSTVKQQRKQILQEAKQQAEDLLKESNATIENTIRRIKEAGADREQTKLIRSELESYKEKVKQTKLPPQERVKSPKPKPAFNADSARLIEEAPPVQVGARVRKRGGNLIGEVISLTDKQALVGFGSIQSYIPLKQLEYVSARQAKEAAKTTNRPVFVPTNVSEKILRKKMSFNSELDLRGMRVDEALQELINYIDDAVMVGAEEVRILHGTGTGALRQVVRDYLKMQHRVRAFHDAHPDQGGAGITIAEL